MSITLESLRSEVLDCETVEEAQLLVGDLFARGLSARASMYLAEQHQHMLSGRAIFQAAINSPGVEL